MEKAPLEQLASVAEVTELGRVPRTRAERLARWRDLLLVDGKRPLRPLRRLESLRPDERVMARADHSPLALAFADPVLRAAGLAGDTVGHAEAFFGLSAHEVHFLVCDCHYLGNMNGERVARRIAAVSHPNRLVREWRMFRSY